MAVHLSFPTRSLGRVAGIPKELIDGSRKAYSSMAGHKLNNPVLGALPRLFRDFRVKWDKGFGAGGRRGIFLLQKAVTFSFAGFLEKEDAVVGVGMMV